MDPRILPAYIKTLQWLKNNLDIYYPVVEGLKNPKVQEQINNKILDTVNDLIREQGYYENPLTEITGTYEIKNNERGILSISLINYAYSGGAHGRTIVKSLTFDNQTGKIYELKDLFKPGADYEKLLSDIIKKQIAERDIPTLEEFKGINSNQDFYVADKILVIYFQQYELAPYAWGLPDFPIIIYEIQDIIDEQGPLGKLSSSF